MAGGLKEKQLAQHVYGLLQAASCPMVEGLFLQESSSKLQLLCTPSQCRTDILAWICSRVNPNFSKEMAARSKGPDILNKEMAALGQELMLCKADDLNLIKGEQSPLQQLQFFKQLLSLVPDCRKSPLKTNEEILLSEIFVTENLDQLTQMLKPSFDPWPAHIKVLHKETKPSSQKPRSEEADVASLLQLTQSALEQLQSECEFLTTEVQSPGVFSPSALRVAASDLQQLMDTFTHVYDTDFKAYCNRDPPSLSKETEVFQRVHQLLLACNTELEILNEVTEASVSMTDDVSKTQMQPRYWSRGEKHTLSDQLEELTRRYRDFLSLLHS